MILKAFFAWLHYLSFIAVLSTLIFEWVLFKQVMSKTTAKLIQKIDSVYGFAAILVLATGGIRLFYLEKGYDFYISNTFFVAKLLLFLTVGLLSIYPTIVIIKWRNQLQTQETLEIEDGVFRKVSILIRLEVICALFIPLLAALAVRTFV